MANLQVKNVPPEVYEELRRRAAQRHVTIRDYVLDLLIADQERQTTNDWLDEIRARGPLGDGSEIDAAEAVRAARAEREHEMSGWVDELGQRLKAEQPQGVSDMDAEREQ